MKDVKVKDELLGLILTGSENEYELKAGEIAYEIVNCLGPKYWFELLESFRKIIGFKRISEATGVKPGTVSSALKRFSMSKELAIKLFFGLARDYPNILKTEYFKIKEQSKEKIEEIWEKINELEGEFMAKLGKPHIDHDT